MAQMQSLQQALATLWPELPSLIGNDWPDFERKLKEYLTDLAAASDARQVRTVDTQIRLLFFDYEQADARLSILLAQAKEISQRQVLEKGLYGNPLQPSAITRYHCPGNGMPHWLSNDEVVRSVSGLALCPLHLNTLVTAEKTDGEN